VTELIRLAILDCGAITGSGYIPRIFRSAHPCVQSAAVASVINQDLPRPVH